MDTGEIVAAVVTFLAVVVALGIGVISLRQTKNIQEKQYRLERLNKINAWAIDIAKCESESEVSTIPVELQGSEEEQREQFVAYMDRVDQANLMLRWQAIDARSGYMRTIASEFGGDLQGETVVVARMLANHILFIRRLLEGKTSDEKYRRHWYCMTDRAIRLTQKIAGVESEVAGS